MRRIALRHRAHLPPWPSFWGHFLCLAFGPLTLPSCAFKNSNYNNIYIYIYIYIYISEHRNIGTPQDPVAPMGRKASQLPTAQQAKVRLAIEGSSRPNKQGIQMQNTLMASLEAMPVQTHRHLRIGVLAKPKTHQTMSKYRRASLWLQEQTRPRPTDRARN